MYGQPTIAQEQPWEEVKKNGRGTITIFWYESRPFIYHVPGGMAGIEYDIMQSFRKFLKERHNVDLKIEWKEASDFSDTYEQIKKRREGGVIGASAFSITPERQKEVAFTAPYMSDISVLITIKDIPIL